MTLQPDHAIALLTAGVLLVYLEINRPGLILPGAVGLIAALVSIASLIRQGNMVATVLLLTAITVLLVDLLRPTHAMVSAAACLALTLGFFSLSASGIAILCGTVLGLSTTLLTRVAHRARTNKRVN